MSSVQLSALQVRAIEKLGNVICPGDRDLGLPSFIELGCVEHADIVLNELPESDLKDLKLLLTIFAFLPSFFIAFLLGLIERGQHLGGEIGTLLRMVRFGLRGVAFSLYYSGLKGRDAKVKTPYEAIGYSVTVAR